MASLVCVKRPPTLLDHDKTAFKDLYEDWIVSTKLQYEQERLEKINQLADKIVQSKLDSLKKLETEGQVPRDTSHITRLEEEAMRGASTSKRKYNEMDEEPSITMELTWKQEKQADNAESIESIAIPNRDDIVSREMSKISKSLETSNTGHNALTRIFIECPMKTTSANWISPVDRNLTPSDHQRLLNSTFSYIHSRGYFVTRATKFGCDFLVYEGDPSVYHSKYMIYCLSGSKKSLPALQLVNMARLSSTVKKQLLIAKWDDEDNQPLSPLQHPSFFVLEWTGNYNPRKILLERAQGAMLNISKKT